MRSIKIERASWIITLDQKRRIIKDGSIYIEDGKIVAVEKADKLRLENADIIIEGLNKVITPGFINTHMHISYAHPVRGIFPDNLPRVTYLSHVFKLQSSMKPSEEYYTTLLGVTELLKNGCTCFADPGSIGSLEAGVKAIDDAGIRAVVGRDVVDIPNPLNLPVRDTNEAVKTLEDTLKSYSALSNGRVKAWVTVFSPDYASDELLIKAKELADRYHTVLTLHTSFSEEAVKSFEAKRGRRPIEHLAHLEILDENVLLSHALVVNDYEIDLLAKSGTKVVHCPSAAVRGGGATKFGKFPEMLAKGIRVSLGSDSANSSYYLDMVRLMYLAMVLYKDARLDKAVMPPESVLEMGTVNGAWALGLNKELGSIEVEKKADLVVFDTKRCEWRSIFYPVNNLVYSADGRSVDTVIVDGRIVVQSGKPLYVNEGDLCERVQQIGEDILERTNIFFNYSWQVE
ncbi:MAG: amidohydrolase family protein [Candidatus Caldarchaeum sp.]